MLTLRSLYRIISGMNLSEIRKRLDTMSRAKVAKETGLRYQWVYEVHRGIIKDPGSQKLDRLKTYLLSEDLKQPPQ